MSTTDQGLSDYRRQEETPPQGASATGSAAINVFHHGDTAGA